MYLYRKCARRFCVKNNVNNFVSVCRMFQEIENQPKLLIKKKIIKNYLSRNIKEINENKNKENNFMCIGEIIRVSIPYLNLIQNKSDFFDKDEPFEINLKYQYTFDLLIKNYIKNKFGIESSKIQEEYIKHGDLAKYLHHLFTTKGEFKREVSGSYLTVGELLEYKENIVKTIGNKSYNDKLEILDELFDKCQNLIEILYVARIFLNKLKIGIAEKNVIKCVLETEIDFTNKEDFKDIVKYLEKNIFKYQIYYPMKIKSTSGADVRDPENIEFEVTLKPGKFVDLQLGRHGMDLDTFLSTIQKSTQKCVIETKYDGERSQMHFDGNEIQMASRSSQDQTNLYQNLKEKIQKEILNFNKSNPKHKINNFIIDGEIACYSNRYKNFCAFQELRKLQNVNDISDSKQIQYFFIAFDILYLNNVNLYSLELGERKLLLRQFFYQKFKNILVENGKWVDLENMNTAKSEIIKSFNFAKSINCEGVVAKELGKTSQYHFGKRRWYKLKTLNHEVTDTLDLIPIAGFIGKGSSKSQMNSFLMAVYDPLKDSYIGLCKLGTGFDQKDLVEIQKRFMSFLVRDIPSNYDIPRLHRPTFIFKPKEVWEVGFDSFSESMNYSICKGINNNNQDKGVSLRFPRFIKFRNDKTIGQASSPNEIAALYTLLNNKNTIL